MVGTMQSVDQELLHHAAALRSLARRLVGDEADDLVQDVAVQVLQRPPREPGPMHAWLRSIVRHLASSHHRDERRRLEHEAKGKTPETAAWPEQIAAHRETLHRLHTTLMNLQEPYRGILLARFYEGLTPTAIAARSGAPLATVKSSLQRGLAMLRERLDRGGEWR
jgi:RNA polymerase sigma factor (sigma-70 family)